MNIELANIGKRFKQEWIFKNLSTSFSRGVYGIIGSNGSGKSTLLKIISQAELPTEGQVHFRSNDNQLIEADKAYKKLSFVAPYQELPEQLTLNELLKFHTHFKAFNNSIGIEQFAETIYLSEAKHKQIGQFSSGMKQRLKLGLALLGNSPIVLLDEPCSNLDSKGVEFYHSLLQKNRNEKLILIASNEVEKEVPNPEKLIHISDFKDFK